MKLNDRVLVDLFVGNPPATITKQGVISKIWFGGYVDIQFPGEIPGLMGEGGCSTCRHEKDVQPA